ncbi:MAG: hypothetical protein KY469_05700 [Actinobacteria bacterium]|nr:hypothetical protein [Actinomycetota bacterium]
MRSMLSKPRFLASVASAALLATACGGGSSLDVESNPSQALSDAAQNLAESDAIEAVIRLDADADDLAALAAEGGDDLPPEAAEAITNSSLRVRSQGSGDDGQFEMAVVIDGDESIEIRAIGQEVYVRADVRGLLDRFDTTGTAAAELETGLEQMQASGLDFVGPAVEGEWLHLTGVRQVMEMMQGFAGGQQPDEAEVEQVAEQVKQRLQQFFSEEVEVSYIGSEDAGERVRATATGEELLTLGEELFALMGPLAAGLTGGQDPTAAIDELRAEAGADAENFTLPIDVWIDGDRISRVGFDVLAFAELNAEMMGEDAEIPEGLDRLALVIDLNEFGDSIEAPDDAVEVNLFELFGQLGGGLGAGVSG